MRLLTICFTAMKRTAFLFLMAIAAICFATVSCSNDIDDVPELTKQSTISLMAKKDMPDWLAEKITELEKDAPLLALYKVYQCKWKSQTVYYIYYNFASCAMCNTYYADGSKIDWENTADPDDFHKNSTNWKCIYVIEGPHE